MTRALGSACMVALLLCSAPIDRAQQLALPPDDADYKLSFRFTGDIEKLTFRIGPQQLRAE